MKFKLIFAWYDLWVGAFYDRRARKVYLFPLPMLGLRITLPPPRPRCTYCGARVAESWMICDRCEAGLPPERR
jgi:hypothetical protein